MKIQLELKDAKTESAYLGLRKAIPDLRPEEIEAGQKETGVAPLCRSNMDEKLFHLGLQIMIRELTNPGDTIASAIAKATDLTLTRQFMTAMRDTATAMHEEKLKLVKKLGPKRVASILRETIEYSKKIGENGWYLVTIDYRMAGLEQALTLISRVLSGPQDLAHTAGTGTPNKEKKTNVRPQGVPLPRSRPVRRRRR